VLVQSAVPASDSAVQAVQAVPVGLVEPVQLVEPDRSAGRAAPVAVRP
jgi:hypothetical protein